MDKGSYFCGPEACRWKYGMDATPRQRPARQNMHEPSGGKISGDNEIRQDGKPRAC